MSHCTCPCPFRGLAAASARQKCASWLAHKTLRGAAASGSGLPISGQQVAHSLCGVARASKPTQTEPIPKIVVDIHVTGTRPHPVIQHTALVATRIACSSDARAVDASDLSDVSAMTYTIEQDAMVGDYSLPVWLARAWAGAGGAPGQACG